MYDICRLHLDLNDTPVTRIALILACLQLVIDSGNGNGTGNTISLSTSEHSEHTDFCAICALGLKKYK